MRSLLETVACQHLISRRGYLMGTDRLRQAYREAEILAMKLQAMRRAITPDRTWVREQAANYALDTEPESKND